MSRDPTCDYYEQYHLRRVVNASGTLTAYGQSVILPAAVEAMTAVAPLFFEMEQLHGRARATGPISPQTRQARSSAVKGQAHENPHRRM